MHILNIQNTECIKEKEKEELGVKVFYFKIFYLHISCEDNREYIHISLLPVCLSPSSSFLSC